MTFASSKSLNRRKEAMGLKVSYSLIIIDVLLLAFRMFNKNAAEACISINDAIWGNLTKLINSLGNLVGKIPFVGNALEGFVDIFADITTNIETLLNVLPLTLYNFWEILFWVFIIMTACTAVPVIVGKYSVERQYIKARIDQKCADIKAIPTVEVNITEDSITKPTLIEKQFEDSPVVKYKEKQPENDERMEVF